MNMLQGLRRRYRGFLRPTDRAWRRWLKWGRPKQWGRARILRAWRGGDLIAICMLLLILSSVLAPVLLLQGLVRRPFTFRLFVLTATVLVVLGVVLTIPLWTGTVSGEVREAWRDRATLFYLVIGAWIAFTYQKRSSDLAVVRDLYHEWLEVQSRAIQAGALLARPAIQMEYLRSVRDMPPDLHEASRQRLLADARDAQIAIGDAAHRAIVVARRATTLRMFELNRAALRVSAMLNSECDRLAGWQGEILGLPGAPASPHPKVWQSMLDISRTCDRVTQQIETWLRT